MPAAIVDHLQEALDHIRIGSSEKQTKRKYPILKSSLDTINSHAELYGLANSALRILIDAITTPNALDQTSQNAIVRSLYPAGNVPSDLVCTIIGSLGYGSRKASVSAQQMLLRWVIMVFKYLEDSSQLLNFYSVLFNLLDMLSLRADLCHLLAVVTRRKHVKPFRVQMLQNLSRSVGQDASLLKLMHIYEKYAPGSFDFGKSKRDLKNFLHPDPEWGSHLERIQGNVKHLSVKTDSRVASSKFLRRSTESTETTKAMAQPLGVDLLIDQLEHVQISDLTTSDLEDPVLQKSIALTSPERTSNTLDDFLTSTFDQQLEGSTSSQRTSQTFPRLLESVLDYTRYTKVGRPNNSICSTDSPCSDSVAPHS